MPGRTADLSAVRAALAAYLTAALANQVEVHSFVRGSINPPALIVTPAPGTFLDYEVTQADQALNYTFRLVLLASTADAETGTQVLDGMLAIDTPSSPVAALWLDPTLGGVVDYAVPKVAQRYGGLTYGGVDYLGAEILVEIAAP